MHRIALTACAVAFIAACGGSGDSSMPTDNSTGILNISMTDAAVDDVSEVWVEFAGVRLKPQSADEIVIEFDAPRSINLLDLQDGKTEALLANRRVPVGPYNWIRLAVNAQFDNVYDSYVMRNGGMVELRVPSGSQSGLKLVSGFTVTANQSTNIVIDWDLRKALSEPQGQPGMHLRPALRVTDMAVFGSLTGTVAEALVMDESCTNDLVEDTGNAVYLYEGAVDAPLDIRGAETDPVATATVSKNADGIYGFGISYLSIGDYTAAFTCQASDDDPEIENEIAFGASDTAVTIVDGQTANVEFLAPVE